MRLDTDFPAWCFDNTFDPEILRQVVNEFPSVTDHRWQTFHGAHEANKQQGGPECWGPATTGLILNLLSPASVRELCVITGRKHLVGDVVGGGMHQSGPGARLDVHVDFDRHPVTKWRRAVNVLLYLNEGWSEEDGGCLELHGESDPITVTPEFNRLVIFECSDKSWHGHPVPVAPGKVRRSIAVYMYDPDDVPDGRGHSTVWR